MAWIREDQARAVVVLFPLSLLVAHSGATLVLGTWYIDRYFILVVPFLTAAVIRIARDAGLTVQRVQLAVPLTVLVALTIVGTHVVDFNARFDGARAAIGNQLVGQGFRANEIDAGMEWVSFHATEIGVTLEDDAIRPGRNWWTERYPNQPVCVTVMAVDSLEPQSSDVDAVLTVSTVFGREYALVARPGPDSC